MEIETKSPFPGDRTKHIVITRECRERGCRASTPCAQHEQVILRFNVDGQELHETARLSKIAFRELEVMHKEPREMFHMLAEFALLANGDNRPAKLGEGVALL
jgi:hypothetical protein